MGNSVTRDKNVQTATPPPPPHSTHEGQAELTTQPSSRDTFHNGSSNKTLETTLTHEKNAAHTNSSEKCETTLNSERNAPQAETAENSARQEKPALCKCDEGSHRTVLSAKTFSAANDEEEEEEEMKVGESSAVSPHPGLPVDHGWAWVIMSMQFVMNTLMVGYGRTLSIFFMEIRTMFNASVTSTTIVFGVMTAAFGVGNMLVSHVLLSRFSVRKVMLAGCLINAIGIALTALAPNMVYVAVMHCLIGFSHALVFVPGISLVGHYFHRRRSIAISVANSGLSVSALVFPPLTHFLIMHFGTRGALLMVAGIELQCLMAACLMRPVSWYANKNQQTETAEPHHGQDAEPKASTPRPGFQIESEFALTTTHSKKRDSEEGCASSGEDEEDTMRRLLEEFRQREARPDATHHPHHHLPRPVYNRFLSSPLSSSNPDSFLSSTRYPVPCSLEEVNTVSIKKRTYVRELSCSSATYHRQILARQESLVSGSRSRISSLATSMVDVCGSAMSIAQDAVFLPGSNDQEGGFGARVILTDNKTRPKGCWDRFKSVMAQIIDVSLFKNKLFLLILAYVPLGFSGSLIAFYFPSLGVEKGLSKPEAALLLTVEGGVDLVSRLVVGYLADLGKIKRTHMVVGCMTVMGLACQFCRFYSGFGMLAGFAVVYGLVGGVCNNLLAVVIIDLLGLPLLAKVMGLVMVFNSAFNALNHVLIGALVDRTGSFLIPYHYVGGSLFLSSIILLMEPLASRLEEKRLRKLDTNANTDRQAVKA